MTYTERISSIKDFTAENLIKRCREHVPMGYARYPYSYPELNHGLDLLSSEEALDCYMAAYGEMHHSKCMGALQNLPYPGEDNETYSVEIIDWGCGQGIGAISVIDHLRHRNMTQWLKKVTLIEPSKAALFRAVENVKKATLQRVRIVPINEYLPAVGSSDGISGISYESRHIIHVFSNILDVVSIDLVKLATALSASGHKHYLLCVGPLNANAFRIDRFANLFMPENYFSEISDKAYGRTSDSNYIYTCKTKCFVYYGTELNLFGYNPNEKAIEPVYEEYNINLHIANGLMSKEKAWVYYRLQNILNQNDLIYLSPDINGSHPDIVIVRPNVGIAIINVFEPKLSDCTIDKETNLINLQSDNDILELEFPNVALENYKNLFIENFQELTEAVIEDNRNLGIVKTILICTGGTRSDAINLIGYKQYITIYGREFIDNENVSRTFFKDIRLIYPCSVMDDYVLSKIKSELSGGWHSYREGKDISLTKVQKKLAKSIEGSQQKISGVAGSGKTQVLATRTVNAQIRTGGDILLLTYNVTLANYIKIRIGEVRADFPWSKIHIDYYHRFFRKNAHANNLHVHFQSYDEINFFESVNDKLPKYEAILIDEVQDYLQSWLHILRKYFLKEGGEFVVFGDPKQNIYNREHDKDGNIKLGVIPGLWNKELTKSHRFANPILAKLAVEFQRHFENDINIDHIDIDSPQNSSFSFNAIEYQFVEKNNQTTVLIFKIILDFISRYNLDVKDIAIISPQIEILRDTDSHYRTTTTNNTMTAFIGRESLNRISRHSTQGTYEFNRDYNRLDKVMKNRFTMNSHLLKLSSIHSFKGWEAPTIICLIETEKYDSSDFNYEALIYTAITRAKENLLIINVGNMKYHDFFNQKIQMQ